MGWNRSAFVAACVVVAVTGTTVVHANPTVSMNPDGSVCYSYARDDAGTPNDSVFRVSAGIGCVREPSLPRSVPLTDTDRAAFGNCHATIDTTSGSHVLISVGGFAVASGRPRAVATIIQCLVKNGANKVVFDGTRGESGSMGPVVGAVEIATPGPYTLCSRAFVKYDDGEDAFWPGPLLTNMACVSV